MSIRQKLIIGLALAAAVGAFVVAGMSGGTDTFDNVIANNPALEGFVPRRGTEVLQQNDVALLVAPGYRARITEINDIAIPESQQFFSESLRSATFTPGIGKVIEKLQPDQNCAQAEYWNVAAGESESQLIGWCFTAF